MSLGSSAGREMSRISGLRKNNNKRNFYKERRINKRCIHFLSKQNLKAPLILDICMCWTGVYWSILNNYKLRYAKLTFLLNSPSTYGIFKVPPSFHNLTLVETPLLPISGSIFISSPKYPLANKINSQLSLKKVLCIIFLYH